MATHFSGAPGQDLSEVIARFTSTNLYTVLDPDVVALINAVTDPEDRLTTLRRVAVNVFRHDPERLMRRRDVREICLNATSASKVDELAARLRIPTEDILYETEFRQDPAAWSAFLGFYGLDIRRTSTPSLTPDTESVPPELRLFPHQRHVANRAYGYIRHGHGRLLLHMPTGTGKTRTAMHVVSRLLTDAEPCVVVWLAASAELLDQAANAFQTAWSRFGNRDLQLTRFWGQHLSFPDNMHDGILVAGLQKIHSFSTRSPLPALRVGSRTRLVVVDEAHQAVAPTYRKVINVLAGTGPNTALLGLTATPGRTSTPTSGWPISLVKLR